MRLNRNNWLAGLTCQEFLNLDPWTFITHPASLGQWEAAVRSSITVRMSDDEILSILYPGLHTATFSAIRNYAKKSADELIAIQADLASRGADAIEKDLALLNHQIKTSRLRVKCLVGYALSYIQKYGLALIIEELPGHESYLFTELDTIDHTPRAHALQHEYMLTSSNYNDSLTALPQFLSDGVVLSDEGLQLRHQYIETIRRFLTPRQHQILRLSVIEQQEPAVMSEMLGLTTKQVWKVRRALNARLGEIAIDAGVCPKFVSAVRHKTQTAEAQ